MCTGATRGFAILKFSTSPRIFGVIEIMDIIIIIIMIIGKVSFTKNMG